MQNYIWKTTSALYKCKKCNSLEETEKTMKLSAFKIAVTEQKIGQYRA